MPLRTKPIFGAIDGPRQLADVHHAIVSCERCPRLREYCGRVALEKKRAHRDQSYWGRPVPGFGDPGARVLLVGLAPAAHGANRTGRIFTGDGAGGSGDFLMAALHAAGFANRTTSDRIDDGLRLDDVFITMAVRCAPPDNKPLPEEIERCRDHLVAETELLPRVRAVIGLGRIGFDAALQLLRRRGLALSPRPVFSHGGVVTLPRGAENDAATPAAPGAAMPRYLIGCYHPSRQNTNTGRLTPAMMTGVFRRARALIDED